jgi:endonuclease/exonuclease/phosphatase family metal-dependent hydrolase
MRFRLITYNIHKGIGGVDRRYRPDRVAATLAHYEPDIVFMQEVASGVPRSHGHRQVDWFGDELGLKHRVFQANVRLRQGEYGNAILSRHPLSDCQDIELTVPLKKRRRALAARCHLQVGEHRRTLALFNFHLGLAGYERVMQLRRLLRDAMFTHTQSATALILGGDLNDVWGTLGRKVLEPAGLKPASGLVHTFPAFRPLRPLNRLYYRGSLNCRHCFRSRFELARYASDHLPVIAEFELV